MTTQAAAPILARLKLWNPSDDMRLDPEFRECVAAAAEYLLIRFGGLAAHSTGTQILLAIGRERSLESGLRRLESLLAGLASARLMQQVMARMGAEKLENRTLAFEGECWVAQSAAEAGDLFRESEGKWACRVMRGLLGPRHSMAELAGHGYSKLRYLVDRETGKPWGYYPLEERFGVLVVRRRGSELPGPGSEPSQGRDRFVRLTLRPLTMVLNRDEVLFSGALPRMRNRDEELRIQAAGT